MIILLNLVFVFSALILIAVVLVQEGKGGGLGNAFGGAGQQTFGVGTSGITKFTAVICAVMLSTAVAIHILGDRESTSLLDGAGTSLLDGAGAGAGAIEPGPAPAGGESGTDG